MKCNYDDCFTCPYPDCILDMRKPRQSEEEKMQAKLKRSEYQRKYYAENKEEIQAKRKKKYRRAKYGKFI